ncbi:MAG: PAS domain-containing protein, partial [Gemmatimonadetes bacterium]|nr:PAS domain-containing protein [Gemmatimonadota bacterium]
MDQPTDQDTDSLQLQRRLDQLQSQMDLMKKASARDQAIARVRDSVWRMVSDGDIGYVLNSVGESLVELGIAHRKCEINLIDDLVNPNLVVAHATRGGDDWDNTDAHFFNRTVIGFWQEKKPVYRSDLAKEDLFGEAKLLSRGIRSVIDVPFSHGTLAVNSCEPSAFQPHDIETLGMLAVALSEAFVRLEDIRKLKKASQQLHNLHEISRLTISTLDRKEILDTLAKQVVATGVLRSLAVALVDRQAGRVVRVQGYHLDREVISSSDEGDIVSYDLDDPDILAETVRTGEIQIVLEWDERFTPRDSTITPESRRGQVAYFIPVKAHDEVIAVVATGSTVADQKETTDRLIEMQPLWDQVAVALSNAAHYEAAQAEIDERKKLAAALTREGEMRDAVACVQVAIADMNQPADLTRVVKLIREQVERVGVTCDSLSIQIVDPSGTEFVSVGDGLSPHDQEVLNNLSMWRDDSVRGNAQAYPWVIEVWRTGEPRFGHSARIGGIRGEGNARELSLIDVPFSGGTLAINNRQLHAYNDEDVAVLQRFATALSDGFERFVIIIERNQAERHKEAVNRIREQVWFMEDDEDLVKVLDTVGDALRDGGVTFCDCDINLVEVTGEASSVRHYNPQRKTWVESPNDTAIRLVQLWSERTVAYRRDLHQEDGYDEAGQIEKAFGHRARSVVDVPFSDGTLAVNHDQPDAFSESDLGLLQEIAAVLTEGFNRVRDLTTLRENERQYRSLFENMVDGFALHEIVLDEDGTPADYVFLEMNGAFEQLTGLRRESVIGRRVTEVLPGIEDDPTDWIGRYGRVVATGEAT